MADPIRFLTFTEQDTALPVAVRVDAILVVLSDGTERAVIITGGHAVKVIATVDEVLTLIAASTRTPRPIGGVDVG